MAAGHEVLWIGPRLSFIILKAMVVTIKKLLC